MIYVDSRPGWIFPYEAPPRLVALPDTICPHALAIDYKHVFDDVIIDGRALRECVRCGHQRAPGER